MDDLRRLQRSPRYDFPRTIAYRLGLALLVIMWVLVLLVPSWWFALADPQGVRADAVVRVVCATLSTGLIVEAVVGDVRGHRPFNRSWSFVAAMALLLASMLLPRLV